MADQWFVVDREGLRKSTMRRGVAFVAYELWQNAADEDCTRIDISVTQPQPRQTRTVIEVVDDSPEGFRNLSHAYTLFADSYKKADAEKRGAFNLGEKLVLAMCEEASISTTKGTVKFNADGTRTTSRTQRDKGTLFRATIRMNRADYDEFWQAMFRLIPSKPTFLNGVEIPMREVFREFETTLPTMVADEEGIMRRTSRKTKVQVYLPKQGETAMLYEMGIPVVAIDAKYHVSVNQKVPLNVERDNVPPSYLKTLYVELLNRVQDVITKEDATATWVRVAASDERCSDTAITKVLDLRFGAERVSYDPSDIGSNREAASNNYVVVPGGSMTAGEWENARRASAISAAGSKFPTSHGTKVPDKVYERSEWTPEMEAYAKFVEAVSFHLVGRLVTLCFIKDTGMVHGQFFGDKYMVNLAHHDVSNWQQNLELMLHELAHTVVKSNDHLCREFYDTVTTLGAKLALYLTQHPELVKNFVARKQISVVV